MQKMEGLAMSTASDDRSEHRAAEAATAESGDSEPGTKNATVRRPYTAPRLQRIGEVRDLTFGSSGTPNETQFPSRPTGPGRAPPHQ